MLRGQYEGAIHEYSWALRALAHQAVERGRPFASKEERLARDFARIAQFYLQRSHHIPELVQRGWHATFFRPGSAFERRLPVAVEPESRVLPLTVHVDAYRKLGLIREADVVMGTLPTDPALAVIYDWIGKNVGAIYDPTHPRQSVRKALASGPLGRVVEMGGHDPDFTVIQPPN